MSVNISLDELRELMLASSGDIHESLRRDYIDALLSFKYNGHEGFYEEILELKIRLDSIGDKFPNMSQAEVNESMILCGVLQDVGEL